MPRKRDAPRILYIKITKAIARRWDEMRRREWRINEPYYARAQRRGEDRYRPEVTHPALLKTIPQKEGLRILDAGCGEGSLLRDIAQERPASELYGIDLSEYFLKAAREEEFRHLKIRYLKGDMRATPFPDEFFDVIVSHHAINYLVDPENALKEFYRILKIGGSISLLMQHMNYEHEKRYLPGEPISIHYLQEELIRVRGFIFGGRESPGAYSRKHETRSLWDHQIYDAGFELLPCEEPAPSVERIKKDSWFRKHFATPRFILLRGRRGERFCAFSKAQFFCPKDKTLASTLP